MTAEPVQPLQFRVDQGVMALNGYSTFPKPSDDVQTV